MSESNVDDAEVVRAETARLGRNGCIMQYGSSLMGGISATRRP